MSRESEVAARLRADSTLMGLLTGGIYEASALGDAGITDPTTTPGAYSGGLLKPSAIVRQRMLVPFGSLRDLAEQVSGASQVVEVYVYQRGGTDTIESALGRIYALLQGHVFDGAYPAMWSNEIGPMSAPELSGDVRMARTEYQIISVRVAA